MSLTWKLSISASESKGRRDHMEDFYSIHIEKVCDKNIFAFFGVFDGHGGHQAAEFVKKNLVSELMNSKDFWSDSEDDVKNSIKDVFFKIQGYLWIEREKWPKTVSGYKSTAGTTASIALLRNSELYIGHVGDSAILLMSENEGTVKMKLLTEEHKPENEKEKRRVLRSGGFIVKRGGTERVVWKRRKRNRPKVDSEEESSICACSEKSDTSIKETVQQLNYDTLKVEQEDEQEYVPFLAVTRSLGDLWSYDNESHLYHVSPEPDVTCVQLCPEIGKQGRYRLVLGSDGVWSVLQPHEVAMVFENKNKHDAESLLCHSLDTWMTRGFAADNVAVIVVQIDFASESVDDKVNGEVGCETDQLDDDMLNNEDKEIVRKGSVKETVFLHSVPTFTTYHKCNNITTNIPVTSSLAKMESDVSECTLIQRLIMSHLDVESSEDASELSQWSSELWRLVLERLIEHWCSPLDQRYCLIHEYCCRDRKNGLLPELAYMLDSSSSQVVQSLIALPWAAAMLDVLDNDEDSASRIVPQSVATVIRRQPLLTSFWTELYRAVVQPTISHINTVKQEQRTTHLSYLLHHCLSKIQNLLPTKTQSHQGSKNGKSTFIYHKLKRSNTFTLSHPIIKHSKLRKSSSYKYVSDEFWPELSNGAKDGSGSSTPLLDHSPDNSPSKLKKSCSTPPSIKHQQKPCVNLFNIE